ncbi:PadR family transcriptional regulator [Paenibacillus sp. DMB20]|uniref:PadR family transcriptional regulator n=1 Tax=Paenibacillus sp. DMB20 TaxID=1642570 RepID=UPI000627743C|nr:PadR family transcriptional regulator [Paenibacillus sp. DMB20]KKO54231.1 PadR family transcriptional regulator [Paenibacillus sp. DMB20]
MTRAMVLGLLHTNGPMSGYEIQQMMQSAQTDLWAYVQPASIYHALKKLQAEGKVYLDHVEMTGMRSKSTFKITEDGVQELKDLLRQSFGKSSVVFPTHLYTALTFMNMLPPEEIRAALSSQEQDIRELYETMKSGQKKKEEATGKELAPEVMAIFQNMYAQCELQLACIEQIRSCLGEGEPS